MNYNKQGGNETVIDGTLTVNGTIQMGDAGKIKFGTTEFKQAAAVAAAAGTAPTKAEFDGLITALKNAGLMKTS